MFGEERSKCWNSDVVEGTDAKPGTVLDAGRDGIVIACGSGALNMLGLQRPGKRAVTAAEFAAGTEFVGRRL